MKVNVVETTKFDCDLKLVDVDVISEEEKLSLKGINEVAIQLHMLDRNWKSMFKNERLFSIGVVLSFSGSDLPVGSTFYLQNNKHHGSSWYVFAKNKAFGLAQFEPDAYTEDESRLKELLLLWANINGIKLGE